MVKNELELHWLSTSRISPAENRIHTFFDLHSYCEAIEDQLFSRALIGAVYRCLLQGILFPLSIMRSYYLGYSDNISIFKKEYINLPSLKS